MRHNTTEIQDVEEALMVPDDNSRASLKMLRAFQRDIVADKCSSYLVEGASHDIVSVVSLSENTKDEWVQHTYGAANTQR